MVRISAGPSDGEVAVRMQQRRQGPLRALDTSLLHNASFADGWNTFLGTLRRDGTVEARFRELAILRVAVLNDASYEWAAHQKVARLSGITAQQMDALRFPGLTEVATAAEFDELDLTVLEFTDVSTREVQVPDELFAKVIAAFGEGGAMELALTAAAYNMVSRFVVSLGIAASDFPESEL